MITATKRQTSSTTTADQATTHLRISNIWIDYCFQKQSRPILEGINWELTGGKIYVLYGPSGQGKTSLVKAISAHIPFRSGDILLDDVSYMRPSRKIFYVHQEDDLFEWLTVAGHIQMCEGLGACTAMGKSFSEKLGINSAQALYPYQLSIGMKRRLSILRALMMNPKVLILDETLSSVDELKRDEIINLLIQWTHQNQTICIIVTHFPEDFRDGRTEGFKITEGKLVRSF